jgi:hypothetical protein
LNNTQRIDPEESNAEMPADDYSVGESLWKSRFIHSFLPQLKIFFFGEVIALASRFAPAVAERSI